MYALLGVCFVFLHIGIGKMMMYRKYRLARKFALEGSPQVSLIAESVEQIKASEKLDWFIKGYPDYKTYIPWSRMKYTEEFVQEAVYYHVNKLEEGLSTMGAWISVAPLLGLLGTVIGMIATFKMITLFGVGDPSLMSEGISLALLTTQAGLMVAFPGLLMLNYLRNKKEALISNLVNDSEALMKQNRAGEALSRKAA